MTAPRASSWAWPALAAVTLAVLALGYSLNRGIYVGSRMISPAEAGRPYHYRDCSYLFPSGVRTARAGGWNTAEEVRQNTHCKLFLE